MPPPPVADPHLRLRHPLYPSAVQRRALDHRWTLVHRLWRVLAVHAQLEASGHLRPLREVAHLVAAGQEPTPGNVPRQMPHRSNRDRQQELEAVTQDLGWRSLLGSATLEGLVRSFGRHLQSLGSVARPAAIVLEPPSDFALMLGGLARPVGELHVEIVGIPDLVLAPLYLLPGPAQAAVRVWRAAFDDRLTAARAVLEAALLAGDPAADAGYLAHIARYGALEPHLAAQAGPPQPSLVSLCLAEAARLHRTPAGDYEIDWGFRVLDLLPPRHQALIALDPGERNLWTWATAHQGCGRVHNPLKLRRAWVAPQPAAPVGLIQHPLDHNYARMRRHQLLFHAQVQPVLEQALRHLLLYAGIGIEHTTLERMARRGLDYAPFVAFTGLRVYETFLAELARLDPVRRALIWVPPEGTSADCSACGARRTMRYARREGRRRTCASCGVRLNRDLNAARNIYWRAAADWPDTLPWRPAALPCVQPWTRQ